MTALRRILVFSAASLLATPIVSPSRAAEPNDLSGTWVWSWKDAAGATHRHVLEVEGTGADLAARERFDDQEPVKATELKRDGKQVRLVVVRGDRRSEYSGVLADATTINGTVTVKQGEQTNDYPWKATRRQPPK
jgi:hypothetical protein